MCRKRITLTLVGIGLIISTLGIGAPLMYESEPVKVDYDTISDLKDFKLKQVQAIIDVEIQKHKEEEAKRLVEEQRLKELEEQRQRELEESKKQYWTFEVSYYCGCYYCTQNGNLMTASGEIAQEGVTIALPSDIPFGSEVHIDNVGDFIVQDRGGFIQYTYDENGNKIMRVDVYISDHNRALELGRHIESGYIKIN